MKKPARRKPGAPSPPASIFLQQAIELIGQGQAAQALAAARQGLALTPRSVELRNIAAVGAMRLGDYAQAEHYLKQAIEVAQPQLQALLQMNLGTLLTELGRWEQADACYRASLALNPRAVNTHFSLGVLQERRDHDAAAEGCYRRALELAPAHAASYFNLGHLLSRRNRTSEAETCYRQALAIEPANLGALINLGALLQKSKHFAEAEQCYARAIEIDGRSTVAHLDLGRVLLEQGRYEDAERALQRAVMLDEASAAAQISYGQALSRTRPRYDDAIHCFDHALSIDPASLKAQLAKAATFERFGHIAEAEQVLLQVAQAVAPDTRSSQDRYDLGLALLRFGHFREGWLYHEARLAADFPQKGRPPPAIASPRWQGEPLRGRSLLLWPEQGFGDTIQFCRYASLLKSQGVAWLALACNPELVPLLRGMAGVDLVFAVDRLGELEQTIDYWTYLLSLPLHCGTVVDTIPAQLPYLRPDPQRAAEWSRRLPVDGRRVGLVWKGNPAHGNDHHRSLAEPASLAPLWSLPDVNYISLQTGTGAAATAPLLDLGSSIRDFADTAAILSQLDLLITVDTAAAHLAGALGIPCWVLLPYRDTDWRWLRNRSDSPWYPGVMRLFQQAADEVWERTSTEVAQALNERIAQAAN